MKKLFRHILLLLASCPLILTSCTDPGLEMETPMSHIGNVRFGYDWSAAGEAAVPDSMIVMAVRVINHYKRGMMMSTENLRGHYVYNAPDNVEAWIDPSISPPTPPPPHIDNNYTMDPTEPYNGGDDPSTFEPDDPDEPEPEPANNDIVVDHFTLPEGTYKFYAVGADKNIYDHVYTNLTEYLAAEGTGMQYSEVEMMYNTHRYNDIINEGNEGNDEKEVFVSLLGQDFNQGFDIIQTDYPAIFIDRLELKDIPEKQDMEVTFTPKPLTQNIDIYINIEKDISEREFTIEQVVGEISGIPSKATAFDGHLTLSKTNKMQFTTTLTDMNGTPVEDQLTNTKLRVHANINVLSILHSSKPTDLTGPGILQISVMYRYSKTDDDGVTKEINQRVFGKLNLYHVLKEANLISYSSDFQYATKSCDHAVLNIPATIKITPEGVLSGDGSNGGFGDWEQCGDAITPDGDDMELY